MTERMVLPHTLVERKCPFLCFEYVITLAL